MSGKIVRFGNFVVPWTAKWTSEDDTHRSVVRTVKLDGHAMRFICEGINTPGVGKPLFKILHNDRCRSVLRDRVCQICRARLPKDPICINQGETDGIYPLINDGLPMCVPCAALSLAQCPGLQRAETVGRLRLWRASAWLHAPILLKPVPHERGGNPHLNALLAMERGPVFSGVKLLLTRFRAISADELRDITQ